MIIVSKRKNKIFALILAIAFVLSILGCKDIQDPASLTSDIQENDHESNTLSGSEGETEPEATTSAAPLTWRYAYMLDTPPENRPYDSSITYDEDVLNTYVKLPLVYEEEFDGIIYKIEFYEEIVPMHSYIISRITVTNTTDAEICYHGSNSTPGAFEKENGDTLTMRENSWMNRFCTIAWIKQIYPGESFVHQSVHFVSSDFFQYGNKYIYKNYFSFSEDYSTDKHNVSFPIEVLKHE